MRDDSAEILFQSVLWEAIVSSYGMDRDVHRDAWAILLSVKFSWPL